MSVARYAVEGLGWLAQSVLGNTITVEGMTVGPNSPAALNVVVQPGAIYAPLALDDTAYSTMGTDTHVIMQQGLLRDAVTLPITPPATTGQSRIYLVQAICQVVDTDPSVLPYYNAADPDTAFSGPGDSGTPQNTRRAVRAVVSLKAGVAAATGSEVAPTPDAGYVALAQIDVPNGASAITSGNISANASLRRKAGTLPDMPGRLLNVQSFNTPGTFTYTPTIGTNFVIVEVLGGGGGGGGTDATSAGQCAGGSGGAGGGKARKRINSGFAAQTVVVAVGGASATLAGGAPGGTSSFGAFVSATGGTGGTKGVAQGNSVVQPLGGAGGGVGVGGDENWAGSAGLYALYGPSCVSGQGGASAEGGGGAGPVSGPSGGATASSPGAGGSGGAINASASAASGGAGGSGRVRIWEYS